MSHRLSGAAWFRKEQGAVRGHSVASNYPPHCKYGCSEHLGSLGLFLTSQVLRTDGCLGQSA